MTAEMDSPAYFSTDQEAIEERNKCDYSYEITTEMARSGNVPRKIRIYADGIWDTFHRGHAEALRQAKTFFPLCQVHLIVGVPNDTITHAIKGPTVWTDSERADMLRHCRYVNEVLTDAPWDISAGDNLVKYKIDFVAHDEAVYVMGAHDEADDLFASLKEKDMFIGTKRTEGISTTNVISRIIDNLEVYADRNAARGFPTRISA